MYYLLQTFGCQMNEHDSEIIAGHLKNLGYAPVQSEENADVVLLITCCVREHAESKVYGRLGELERLKSLRPDLVIGIGGCMTQQEDVAQKIRQRFPRVDLIFGTHNLEEFPRLFELARDTGESILCVHDEDGTIVEGLPRQRSDSQKAWVTIMYGCNNFCTYCIVPYVRGRERSRQISDIIDEVTELGQSGYREITLLGQNVNSYGKDLTTPVSFASLLEALEEVPGIARIRYMTSHPRDFTARLVEVIAASAKVCRHFHLPVQSGSDRMLRAMNRGYTRSQYIDLVASIRNRIPEAVITTDFIVGFPGETEEDHLETLSLARELQFDSAFTFAYSSRSGTPAAELTEQLSSEEKNRRLRELIALVNEHSLVRNQAIVGHKVEVLVEGPSKNEPLRLTGRTSGNKLVHFAGQADLSGKLVTVRITSAQTWHLLGEIVE